MLFWYLFQKNKSTTIHFKKARSFQKAAFLIITYYKQNEYKLEKHYMYITNNLLPAL
jgi:hypothetical protein